MQNSKALPSLTPLVAILFMLIVALHLGSAAVGRSLFRASHLGPALEYAHGSIDLLRPVIPGFNATGTPTALEMPLWQATAALVFKIAHSTWFGWANVASLLLFATGLWPFIQLARQYVSPRASGWAAVFFLSQPIVVLTAGQAATDGFSLVSSLWFLFFADKMIRTGQWLWWIPTALFAAMSALMKMPFFMSAGLCTVFLLLIHQRRNWRTWFLLAGAGGFAAIVFFFWTKYTDSLLAQAEYPYQDFRMSTSSYAVFWFFGSLQYRLTPSYWIKGAWRILHATLGSLPMIAVLAAGWARPGTRFLKLWLLASFITTLVFTNLVLNHWHYYLMYCPAIALLCGSAIAHWEDFWTQETRTAWVPIMVVAIALIFSSIDGVITMKIALAYDNFKARLSSVIEQNTGAENKLIVFDPDDWGGEVLFRSGRKGLCVQHLHTLADHGASKGLSELLANPTDLQRLKSLGYDRLVLLSESPVRFAAEAINPGSKRIRRFFPASISVSVDSWPVVYQSEDIQIKQIP